MSDRDVGITRDIRTPAEVSEKRVAGEKLDYRLVVLQANAVGLSASLVVLACLVVVLSFGPLVFWTVIGVVGVTTLIYWLRRETGIERALNDGEDVGAGISAIGLANGIVVTLFAGFVAWCVWRVLNHLNPRTWYTDGRLDFSLLMTRGMALISLEFLVFAFFRFLFLFVAFGQEMLQRSPMQEQFIWQALGEILKAWGLSRVRHMRRPRRPINHYGRPTTNDNGGNKSVATPEPEDELTPEQEHGLELMQFLVLGQELIGEDSTQILYSRRQWNGIRLPSGYVMGVSRARAWAKELSEMGILEVRSTSTGEGLNIARNLTLDSALARLAITYDVPPPHPQERERWVRGAGVPTQPVPACPTQAGEG